MPDFLRVYISSTHSDLQDYREAVVSTLRRFGFDAVPLEYFGSVEQPPLEACLDAIAAADIVILLVAHRLGYVPPDESRSLVEIEYDKTRELAKPVLRFLLDDRYPWPPSQIDADYTRIRAFRERLLKGHFVSLFTTPDDLAARVAMAISQYSRQIEGVSVAPTEPSDEEPPSIAVAEVITELKAMRLEFSALQQGVADALRRAADFSVGTHESRWNESPDFLGPRATSVDPRRCFVIMPYSQKWSGALERIVLEVCSTLGLEFQIAKNMEGRFIPNDIWRGITGAGVIVADLSGANPNVTYEVGLADTWIRGDRPRYIDTHSAPAATHKQIYRGLSRNSPFTNGPTLRPRRNVIRSPVTICKKFSIILSPSPHFSPMCRYMG